jgi:hypothetical protein
MVTIWIAKGWFGHWCLYARGSGSKCKWLGTFPSPEMARYAQSGFVAECKQKGVVTVVA